MIRTQRQLQRELRAKASKVSDEELFMSEAYTNMLTRMQQGIVQIDNPGTVSMTKLGGEELAFTDEKNTTINYSSTTTTGMPKKLKHYFFLGLALHEFGHKIATNFVEKERAVNALAEGNLYPMPKENIYFTETLEALRDNKKKAPLQSIYHHLDNVIEDGFIDRAITSLVPGYGECLKFVNDVDVLNGLPTYTELKTNGREEYEVLTDLIFYYAVHDKILYGEGEYDDIIDAFECLMPLLNKAVYETHSTKRQKLINEVFCYVFHFIKEQEEKEHSGQQAGEKNNSGESQNGIKSESNPNPTEAGPTEGASNERKNTPPPKSMEERLQNLADGMKDSERTKHTSSSTPSNEAISQIEKALKETARESMENNVSGNDTSTNTPQSNAESMSSQLDALASELAMEQIAAQQEKELHDELKTNVKPVTSLPLHGGLSTQINRQPITDAAKKQYDTIHASLDTIVRRFMKEFQKEIKERQLGDTLTGLYNGKRLDTGHLYRNDKRIFSINRLPEDVPNMAVGILIDCSGSMSGGKLEMAKQCAYITYEFCRHLDIPVFVVGHSTAGNTIVLDSVADENSIDGKDAMRIFSLTSHGSNRDGFALRFCLNKLDKIDAQDKLMLVISDGLPAHRGYGMIEGQRDCQDAVEKYMRQGITTIAAGLGQDAPNIRSVYQEGKSREKSADFLDITDIEKMPKAFIKIIKKRLMDAA